jgi:hypothetical protein
MQQAYAIEPVRSTRLQLERGTVTDALALAYSETSSTPFKFNRKHFFPQDRQELLAEFLSLFHRYDYIYKPLTDGSWLSAKSEWKLTDSEILKAISCVHPKFFLGCRSGKATRFAVLDIDAKSKYHNPKELKRLTSLLEAAGLTAGSLYRSSLSGGWHLYIFFQEPIVSLDLRRQLVQFLKLNGYDISKGTLEVFPSPGEGSQGQGLRLPLQPGWAWLNFETANVREERSDLSPLQALCTFLNDLNGDTNSYQDFRIFKTRIQDLASRKEAVKTLARRDHKPGKILPFQKPVNVSLEHAKDVAAIFGGILPPGINADDWYRGHNYYEQGLTGHSQRDDAIKTLSHYFFYGDPSRQLPALGYGCKQERDWAIREIISTKHNGYSDDINEGRADAMAQITRAANWEPPHRRGQEITPYISQTPVVWIRANAKRGVEARKRIADAVAGFNGHPFSLRTLKTTAKCSMDTLYKHQDLWQAAYNQAQQLRLVSDPGEYNAGVGAACSESKPPASPLLEIMPPGRLAARRIAYEIKMRTERERIRSHKLAVQSQETSENNWLSNVNRLTEKDPCLLSIPELKALLIVLIAYIATAPNEESQVFLQSKITRIKNCLAEITEKKLFVVRPP